MVKFLKKKVFNNLRIYSKHRVDLLTSFGICAVALSPRILHFDIV